jgi:glycosyltransferase involved in cell wall biosynthesis
MILRRSKQLALQAVALATGRPAWRLKQEQVRRVAQRRRDRAADCGTAFDLVYVAPPKEFQGWILDAICREVDQFVEARTAFVGLDEPFPSADVYFYSHYGYFREALLHRPEVHHARNILFYTHPRELWYSNAELKYCLNQSDAIISMCSRFADHIIDDGVDPDLVEVGLLGADPTVFRSHQRGNGAVGFCSSYLPRKNGERLLELVQSMPDQSFVLCGRNWHEWQRFGELLALSNFKYLQIAYEDYPAFYNSLDVFVSLSTLEGGPVPLIEAAMSNVVPVCSNTGHAADIIQHGVNGFIFDPAASIAEVVELIGRAQRLQTDVRQTVEHLTWERFSTQVQQTAGLLPAEGSFRSKPTAA